MAELIHPTAVIDPTAELAADVTVGAFAVIGADVRIGAGSAIGAGAKIEGPTVIGDGNRIYSHACIGFDPQDLKYAGERTSLEIGDGNQFREFCTIQRGTGFGGGVTRIGNRNLFMVYTHVAHDCRVEDDCILVNNATLGGHVTVQRCATIGAFSSVHQFCRVGAHAYIGGYSVLTRDVLPFVKTVGAKPACYGINRIGLERRGFSRDSLTALEAAYRVLVRSRMPTNKALERLHGEHAGEEHVDALIAFVEASERGVIRDLPGRKSGRGGGGS